MKWQPIETRPKATHTTYLVCNAKGEVAPWIDGVIHNNPGTAWDWSYGETVTHWMPLPEPPSPLNAIKGGFVPTLATKESELSCPSPKPQ